MRALLTILILALVPTGSVLARDADFDESHSDMFVFMEKPESLRQYGYSGFCKDTSTFACYNRLNYRKHLDKRGYFVTMDTVAKSSGYEFREVVLETGERLFFVAKPYKDNILGIANGDISFVEDIQAAKEAEGQPLVEGSTVSIVRTATDFGMTRYYVNDGEPFTEDKLNIVRGLLNSLTSREHDEELVPLLQVAVIDWDRIEQRYIFRIAPYFVDNEHGPIRASIVKTRSSVSLLERVQYDADDWLFASRYVVVAGSHRYESPSVEFRRDNSGGSVWEWITLTVDDDRRQLLEAVAAESDAIVRFYGSDYYADKEMSAVQRDALRKMLRLHDLLVELSG